MSRLAAGLRPKAKLLGVGLVALVLAGCTLKGPQSTFYSAGKYTRSADRLFNSVMIIVVIVFVLVEGAIVYFLMKYRERPNSPMPVQVHGHTKAEAIWTLIPALILAAVAVPTVKMIFDFAKVPPASNRIHVCVTGHQWWWQYQYVAAGAGCPKAGTPDPNTVQVTTANELVIPTGKPVYASLQSIDVIHSFWVPALNGKQDVNPGRTNYVILVADHPGTYYGQCSQYCGLSHANMRLRVTALSPADYDNWLADQKKPATTPTDPSAANGQKLFLNGRNNTGYFASKTLYACSNCHTVGGTTALGTMGPDLTHLQSRQAFAGDMLTLNDANLKAWLKDPRAQKPGVDMPDLGLSDQEINDLVAYLDTLCPCTANPNGPGLDTGSSPLQPVPANHPPGPGVQG